MGRPRSRSTHHATQHATNHATTHESGIGRSDWPPFAFGIFLTLLGSTVLVFYTIVPLAQVALASSWIETPCTILSSRVEKHVSNDDTGDTYEIVIVFHYDFAGQSYTRDSYDFSIGNSSGYESKQAAVDRMPAGRQQYCYVNPGAPEQAVLNRSLGWYLLPGLLGVPFLAAGLFVASRSRRAICQTHDSHNQL